MVIARHGHQRGGGERNAHGLTLTSVDPAVPERAPDNALGGHARAAMCARAIAERERGDNEIAFADTTHLRADLLHDADELVADRAELVVRFPTVVPEV
jgi:hypothetical protein